MVRFVGCQAKYRDIVMAGKPANEIERSRPDSRWDVRDNVKDSQDVISLMRASELGSSRQR